MSADVKAFVPDGKNIEIICELGKGATGSVWKGAIDGEFVALKQIPLVVRVFPFSSYSNTYIIARMQACMIVFVCVSLVFFFFFMMCFEYASSSIFSACEYDAAQGVKNPRAMRAALKEEVDLMKSFNHPNVLKCASPFSFFCATRVPIARAGTTQCSTRRRIRRSTSFSNSLRAVPSRSSSAASRSPSSSRTLYLCPVSPSLFLTDSADDRRAGVGAGGVPDAERAPVPRLEAHHPPRREGPLSALSVYFFLSVCLYMYANVS